MKMILITLVVQMHLCHQIKEELVMMWGMWLYQLLFNGQLNFRLLPDDGVFEDETNKSSDVNTVLKVC